MNAVIHTTLRYVGGVSVLVLAEYITIYTPLFSDSPMLLPFSAVMLSALFLGKGPTLCIAIGATVAHDYFFVGAPHTFSFTWLYAVEGAVFISLSYLVFNVIEARAKAEGELLKMKDEFLYMTAHDLRSPFQTIASIAAKYTVSRHSADQTEVTRDMRDIALSVDRVGALTDRLTALARTNSPYQKETSVPLRSMVFTILRQWRPMIEQKKLDVQYVTSASPAVLGDRVAVEEIFDNIIGNAVKYARPSDTIRIRHNETAREIDTEVADSGPGIPKEYLEKIFLPYFRTEPSDHKSGTGLGLYIVKKLVEKQRGTIHVQSIVGKGTTFTVRLPRAPQKA